MNQKHSKIIAVIGFSNLTSPMLPLWPTTHRAMLPIVGKPLIVHHIERLAEAGVSHIRIAGSIQQYAVRKRLGDGSEWGVTIRYSDLHGPDLRAECVATSGRCLYLLGDEMLALRIDDAIDGDKGVYEVTPDNATEAGIYRMSADGMIARRFESETVHDGFRCDLANPADLLAANIRVAAGLVPGTILPGIQLHQSAVSDWHSRVSRTAYVGRNVVIGKHCQVQPTARLENDVVLSNGVIIGHGAELQNVVVLPNTFVSSKLRLRDAVVGAEGIMSFDGQFYPATDHGLVGETRPANEARTGIPERGNAAKWLAAPGRLRIAS